jgi:phospholipase D1/2
MMTVQLSILTDGVRDFKTYRQFVTPTKIGHVADYASNLDEIIGELSRIKGHIVNMPLHYMEDESLDHPSLQINELTSTTFIF